MNIVIGTALSFILTGSFNSPDTTRNLIDDYVMTAEDSISAEVQSDFERYYELLPLARNKSKFGRPKFETVQSPVSLFDLFKYICIFPT